MSPSGVILIYDGLCRFCSRAVNIILRAAPTGAIELMDANDATGVARRFPDVRLSRLEEEMCAIRDGLQYWGYDAFRVALARTGPGRLLAGVMRLAPIRAVGIPVYRFVAAHRRRLGCRP